MTDLDLTRRRVGLIVEDSHTQALRLQTLLESAGMKIVVAPTGQAGLDLAGALVPDVIILDVELPDMNGYTVCLMLQERTATAQIPVIMLTHLDNNLATLRGLESGAIEFIPKDVFAEAVLLESLRQMGLLPDASPDGTES